MAVLGMESVPSLTFGTFHESLLLQDKLCQVENEWQARMDAVLSSTSAAMFNERQVATVLRDDIVRLTKQLEDSKAITGVAVSETSKLLTENARLNKELEVLKGAAQQSKSADEQAVVQLNVKLADLETENVQLKSHNKDLLESVARLEKLVDTTKHSAAAERSKFAAEVKDLRKKLDEEQLLNKTLADVQTERGALSPVAENTAAKPEPRNTKFMAQLREKNEQFDRLKYDAAALVAVAKQYYDLRPRYIAFENFVRTRANALRNSIELSVADADNCRFDRIIAVAIDFDNDFFNLEDKDGVLDHAQALFKRNLMNDEKSVLYGYEMPNAIEINAYSAMRNVMKVLNET